MNTNKFTFLTFLGLLFIISAGLTTVGYYTSDTTIMVWNAINMFVSAFFFGLIAKE